MPHNLSQSHKKMCKKAEQYKANNIDNKEEFYLLLTESAFRLILKADITPTSKILLVYLLSKVHFQFEHLYIYLPYDLLEKETNIIKATAINSLKDLDKKGFIKLHKGTNRKHNNEIKEFLFKQPQFYNPHRNQQNIVEMTPFFAKFLKAEK